MRLRVLVAVSLLCLCSPLVEAQRRAPIAYKGVVVTFHGVLKKLTKKEILIESDEKQLLTMRCSSKTRFRDQDGEIKFSDVDLDSRVSIDASEDVDLKLMAINVRVDAARKKTLNK
jgi:hypothetical protein